MPALLYGAPMPRNKPDEHLQALRQTVASTADAGMILRLDALVRDEERLLKLLKDLSALVADWKEHADSDHVNTNESSMIYLCVSDMEKLLEELIK